MRVFSPLLPLGAVLGCGSATPAPPPAPVTAVSVAPEPPPPKTPNAHVEATGCRIEGISKDRFVLSFDAATAGTNFASVITPQPALLVLGESGKPSSVRFAIFGLAIDAQVPENGFPLHARAPLGIAGVYDPDAFTRLHWRTRQTSTGPDKYVDVEVHFPQGMLAEAHLLGEFGTAARCTDVGFSTTNFAPREWSKNGTHAAFTKKATMLAATADGAAVAEIPADASVTVLRSEKGRSEIVHDHKGAWRGWVASADLSARSSGRGVGYGTGRGTGQDVVFPGVTCPNDLPLYVRRSTERTPLAQIGIVRANAHVAFGAAQERFQPLLREQRTSSKEEGTFALEPSFELVVDASLTSACTAE